MNKNTFFKIACVFSLIIGIQSIVQTTHATFIVPNATIAFNFGHVIGIAARVLGSIVIAVYFMKRFLDNRKTVN